MDDTGLHNMISEFISVKEAAVIFAVNEITIRRAIKKGWIIAIKIGDGNKSSYRISKKSIEAIHMSIIARQMLNSKKVDE